MGVVHSKERHRNATIEVRHGSETLRRQDAGRLTGEVAGGGWLIDRSSVAPYNPFLFEARPLPFGTNR
ncbi:protein of unknown function [Candidatus Nitrospira inopinata]|uniref:Uncharacterized protein n=1 Tax=Candidatus Nitrospira inopinata TaxID=1715989 RepID=A0A0S4KT96_9BACT|nr:protein of unknown function [Candidatus Nitrospira inopinata]